MKTRKGLIKEIKALQKAYSSVLDLLIEKSRRTQLPIIMIGKKEFNKIRKIHLKLGEDLSIK